MKNKRVSKKNKRVSECSICGEQYEGFGNNAQPINNGLCCDACNQEVIYQRITQLKNLFKNER